MNGTQAIIAIIAVAAMGLLVYGVISTRRKTPAQTKAIAGSASVTFNDERIQCKVGGKTAEIRWDALVGVAIETTDQGPFVDDVFYILGGEEDSVICPSEARGLVTGVAGTSSATSGF